MDRSLIFVIFSIFVKLWHINAQGEVCYTPDSQLGTCVLLPQCPYLISIYGSNPGNNQVIRFLLGSQRNCGTRSVGRDPIVCCNRPSFNNNFAPPTTTTTSTTTTTTTTTPPPPPPPTPPPPTPPPQTSSSTNEFTFTTQGPGRNIPSGPDSCLGPDFNPGECKSIKQCPILLNRLLVTQTDDFKRFLRSSNAICNYEGQNVCCPIEGADPFVPSSSTTSPTDTTRGPLQARLLTVEDGCGFSNITHTRVIGGEPAKKGAWPWIVLVGYTNNLGELSWKCGGTLITQRHVLTAAHCIKSTLTTVRAGEHDLDKPGETTIFDIPVVKVAKHETYNPRDGHNDLAILYLESDVPITENTRPICMPIDSRVRSMNFVGYTPFVAGWGRTQEGGKSSNVLQEVQIPVLENEVCKEKYQKIGKLVSQEQFDNAVLCAGVLAGGKDSCQGDSGGPLMAPQVINGKVVFFQIGIVSYGIGCARPDIPGVYTRVQSFVDWIERKVAE